jgi:hypothetical protein
MTFVVVFVTDGTIRTAAASAAAMQWAGLDMRAL